MEQPPRPTLSPWTWIVLIGVVLVAGWWLLGLVVGTVFWAVRVAFWIVVVGAIAYAVLTLLGRRPGR